MSTPVEKFAELGTAIQSDWSERWNALAFPEKDLWAGMSRPTAYLHAVFLSGQGADFVFRNISMYNRLYADIHELSYPFSASGRAMEEPENVPDKPEMPPSVKQNLSNQGLLPKLPEKYKASPVAEGQPALPSLPAAEGDRKSINSLPDSAYSTPDTKSADTIGLSKPDNPGMLHGADNFVPKKHPDMSVFAAGNPMDTGNRKQDAGITAMADEEVNVPSPPNPESDKFMEVRGWGQLGNFLQGVESDSPGILFPKEEGLPDHGSPYLAEKNNTEDKDPEKYGSSAVSDGSFSNDLQRATVEDAAEEPTIQELQKQPPAELDFDEWFTEMQWRLNLEFKRYYGR